jgi:hypothetical protein
MIDEGGISVQSALITLALGLCEVPGQHLPSQRPTFGHPAAQSQARRPVPEEMACPGFAARRPVGA